MFHYCYQSPCVNCPDSHKNCCHDDSIDLQSLCLFNDCDCSCYAAATVTMTAATAASVATTVTVAMVTVATISIATTNCIDDDGDYYCNDEQYHNDDDCNCDYDPFCPFLNYFCGCADYGDSPYSSLDSSVTESIGDNTENLCYTIAVAVYIAAAAILVTP